jgi:hypothetical protein
VIDFWVKIIIEGYIIEFVVVLSQSFLGAEEHFKMGACGRQVKEVVT